MKRALTVAGSGALAAGVFWLARHHLVDDAYITLSYARNLAQHGQWGLIEGMESNTATSPANVLALGGLIALVRGPVLACGILIVLSAMAFTAALTTMSRKWTFPAYASLLVLVNPLMVSSIGLEPMLGSAALAWIVALKRPDWRVGILLGITALIRLDLVVIALVVIIVRLAKQRAWGLPVFAAAAVVAVPWFAWSWWSLGSAIPDTLIIKSAEHSWAHWNFANGLGFYLAHQGWATVASCLLPALSLLLLAWRAIHRQPLGGEGLWLCGAIVHFGVYCLLGVPPYHWYYAPITVAGTVYVVAQLRYRPTAIVGFFTVFAVAVYAWQGVPREVAPISTNHATSGEYAAIARELPGLTGGLPVRTAGEIGALAYFCDCVLVDGFSDRGQVLPDLRERRDDPGVGGVLWRLNLGRLDASLPGTTLYGFPFSAIKTDFQLEWLLDPVPGAVRSWAVYSPTRGHGFLSLVATP